MNKGLQYFAIAVVLVAVVLIAFYALSSSPAVNPGYHGTKPGTCTGTSTSTCSSPSYNHSTGNLSVQLMQSSGSNWTVASAIFVPAGTAFSGGTPVVSWNDAASITGGLPSGVSKSVRVPVSGPVSIGQHVAGTIWAQYQITTGGTVYYMQLATFDGYAG
ncbi:MAG: hypothetical protein KGI00_05225 [Candidatus Micrarchaeota archaeon]|nr:hypothetical protein [Candidatus Micrarchaeota archaeon]MDE1824597.1 hypothetical protein [Candidatus Micrarchaeota archaeon]MDE1850099.1 hypothetical protein [Candidatus Micrarchaeota archaeon]